MRIKVMGNVLSLNECKSLKGVAILLIILHNLLHIVTPFKENERFFDGDKAVYYLEHFQDAPIISFFSYFGWMGVALFALLTGYGLSIKYGNRIQPLTATGGGNLSNISILQFIKAHYLKLFVLVLIPYSICYIYKLSLYNWYNFIPDLLFVRDIFSYPNSPFGEVFPVPYWYLGMCMELYVFFAVCNKYLANKYFVAITLLISIVSITLPDQQWIRYSKYHFLGWLPAFYVGVFLASMKPIQISMKLRAVIVAALLCLYLYTSLSQSFWFISDLIGAVCLVAMTPFLNNKFTMYIGGVSAYIFVWHPLVRTIWLKLPIDYMNDSLLLSWGSIIAYVLVCIAVSELYSRFLKRLSLGRIFSRKRR